MMASSLGNQILPPSFSGTFTVHPAVALERIRGGVNGISDGDAYSRMIYKTVDDHFAQRIKNEFADTVSFTFDTKRLPCDKPACHIVDCSNGNTVKGHKTHHPLKDFITATRTSEMGNTSLAYFRNARETTQEFIQRVLDTCSL